MAVAYLDGKTPSLIVERGTYNVMQVHAYEYQQGTLKPQWKWDDTEEGPRFRGQGAHSMHAVDIDGDGRDELFLGSSVLDDNGVGLWSTGMGHPDHHYVGDIDPSRPGLEVYYGVETRATANRLLPGRCPHGRFHLGNRYSHAACSCHGIVQRHRSAASRDRMLLVRYRRREEVECPLAVRLQGQRPARRS